MPMHNFLWVVKCSCILFCEYKSPKFEFELNSNLFANYKKDLEKKKDFLTPIHQWAETRLVVEPGPASPSFPLPLSLFPCSPRSSPPI
jgi:hypothetical protein